MKQLLHLLRLRILALVIIVTFPLLMALQGDFGSLEGFLIWIVSGGGAMLLAGSVVALLLENWPAWHDFPRWIKVTVPIALAGGIGVLAQGALALELHLIISPAFATLILVLINWLASQWQYMRAKEIEYGAG